METPIDLILFGLIIGFLLFVFTLCITFRHGERSRKSEATVKTTIILGPGGHCREMLTILKKVDFANKFKPVLYVIGSDDKLTIEKLRSSGLPFDESMVKLIRRSRHVGQSYFTSIFTTLLSLLDSIKLVYAFKCDLVICNGPGTCIPPMVAALLICRPTVIFIESFCRTKSLSLSGKIAYYLADHILVQWPDLVKRYTKCKYVGLLV